jgi:hypothetical protein
VKFEIPYFTVSGIQVRYLKVVEKSGYQALPWVRVSHNGSQIEWAALAEPIVPQYITQNGDDYILRTVSIDYRLPSKTPLIL